MANEIQFPYKTANLTTVTASMFQSGNVTAGTNAITGISMNDSTSSGVYWGSVPTTPSAPSAGLYSIAVYNNSTLIGTGELNWDGQNEIVLTDIESKTTQLTFTTPNVLDANIQYVNDVQVKGVGSDVDPWNPV